MGKHEIWLGQTQMAAQAQRELEGQERTAAAVYKPGGWEGISSQEGPEVFGRTKACGVGPPGLLMAPPWGHEP